MEIKLNTKLRLENSALGTYDGSESDSGISFKIPKNLKPENLIGTIVHVILNDDGRELNIYSLINSVSESSGNMTCALSNGIGSIIYLSETGDAVLSMSL